MKCLNIPRSLEVYFRRHGSFISRHPVKVILACLGLSLLGLASLLNFRFETNAIRLWMPEQSDFLRNYNYLWEHHPPEMRLHSMIFTAGDGKDILQPEYIRQMYKVRRKIDGIRWKNQTWNDFCMRVPVVKLSLESIFSASNLKKRRRRRDTLLTRRKRDDTLFDDDPFFDDDDSSFDDNFRDADPSVTLYPEPFCGFVEAMETACFESSILELWANDGVYDEVTDRRMANLTREDILDKINNENVSGLYLIERNFHKLLGGITYEDEAELGVGGDSSSRRGKRRIIGAKAAIFNLFGKMNGTAALEEGVDFSRAIGELVDRRTQEMESLLIETLNTQAGYEHGFTSYLLVARSFSDVSTDTIYGDVKLVVLGYMIVFVYVGVVLGRMDCVENRWHLSFMGLLSVQLALFLSFGISCSLGFDFTPLHNFIPFLLMGLGIDDMFVIMQSWNNYARDRTDLPLEQRFGVALEQAGVAITVTSLTDFLAFAIGASTVLPALKSFCVFCGVGIILVYLFQITWFVAWMTLDQRRIESNRNFFCCQLQSRRRPAASPQAVPGQSPAAKHKGQRDQRQMNLLQRAFHAYGRLVAPEWPFKMAVLAATAAIFGLCVYGNSMVEQNFDPMLFLPSDSYPALYHQAHQKYFPQFGDEVRVFMTDLDLPNDLPKIDHVVEKLTNHSDDLVSSVNCWYNDFKEYYEKNFQEIDGVPISNLTSAIFSQRMGQFLFSPLGSQYRLGFSYDGQLECGEPAPRIAMSLFEFNHPRHEGGNAGEIAAMNAVKKIVNDENFTEGVVFPFSRTYAELETDEVISWELYRNMLLAFGCIFLTTLILLSNFLASVLVLFCVILTMVNVGGMMYFWDLSIDTVSCTNLIICIGICVDYAAHVAHAFLQVEGPNRNERVGQALTNIGPAVLNGGFSTLLSFILLANSNSHVFEVFFKIFFLVVVFALFNGLVLLPVLLSLVGPSVKSAQSAQSAHSAQTAARQLEQQEDEPTELTTLKSVDVNGGAANGVKTN